VAVPSDDLADAADRCRPLRSNDPHELGSFTLVGRLGSGGQGVVYLGKAQAGEPVAVKLLQGHGDKDSQRTVAKELAAARKVDAFCTARVLDTGVEGEDYYIVSEYVQGPTLLQAVQSEGPRTGDDLHLIAVGTATALASIHQAGIVHRDLKPGNVLLSPDGPRVIDFGISRAMDSGTGVTSDVIGTPAYMAPEQLAGSGAGPAADVFAWAGLITYTATGRPPFGNDSIPAVINRIVNDEPDLTDVTGTLQGLLGACLVKDPDQRPTARDVLLRLLDDAASPPADNDATIVLAEGAALAATLKLTTPAKPAEPAPTKPKHRFLLIAGTAAAMVAALAALATAVIAQTTGRVANGTATTSSVPVAATSPGPQGSSVPSLFPSRSPQAPDQPTTPTQIADAAFKAMSQEKTASFEHKREEPGADQPTATGQLLFTGQESTNYDMSIGCAPADPGERVSLIGNTGYIFNSGNAEPFDASPDATYSGAAGCALPWAREIRWGTSPYNIPTLLKAATDTRESHSADGLVLRGTVPTQSLTSGNPSAPLFTYFRAAPSVHFVIELSVDYLPRQVELSFPISYTSGGGQNALLTTTYRDWGLAPAVVPPG
jgi:serine/threonine protein kinase